MFENKKILELILDVGSLQVREKHNNIALEECIKRISALEHYLNVVLTEQPSQAVYIKRGKNHGRSTKK